MSRFFSSELDRLSPYTPGEQTKELGLIKLNTNENPYEPSPDVAKVIQEQLAESMRFYPDPQCRELVTALEEYYGLSEGQVMVGNGSDELLGFAFMAFAEASKKMIFPEISYGFYPVFGWVFKVEVETIPLKEDFTVDPTDYYNVNGTIVLANPNAPTGVGLSRKEIEGILQNNRNNLVVIDEAYIDFGGESCIPLIETYDNLLVIQTFSKSRSLAGCRVGFALANREIIEDLNRIKYSFNPYNLDRLAIQIAAASIKDKETFEANRQAVIETREWFASEMKQRDFAALPSQANFVFLKHGQLGGKAYFEALRRKNILVRHFDQPKIRDYVRITIGKKSDMEQVLAATDAILFERNIKSTQTSQ